MTDHSFNARVQVPSSHYRDGYDSAPRWSSYWLQIERALKAPAGPILEIGVGNQVVTHYLKNVASREVTTVDIDPELHPDVVADIRALPFPDQSFSCAIACEVLEHMPFEASCEALCELRRVAGTAIISIPAIDRIGQLFLDFSLWRLRLRVNLSLPRLSPRKELFTPAEHYWELGAEGFPHARVKKAIADAGWRICDESRNPAHPYHYFIELAAT